MKGRQKNLLCFLLCMAVLGSMAACSNAAQAPALEPSQIHGDTQESLVGSADSSAAGALESATAPITTTTTTTASSQSGTLSGYSLTEVGSFEDPTEGSLCSYSDVIVLPVDETLTLYGPSGAVGEYAEYQKVAIGDSGYTMVTGVDAADENCKGLIDRDGNEILPCEALWIDPISGSDRFAAVYYSTGTVSADDDYALRMDASVFCLSDVSTGEKSYYSGYRKIFDLQSEAFVGDIQVKGTSTLQGNSTMLCVYEDHTYTLYDASGAPITQTTASISLSETLAVFRVDGCTYVYDENGEDYTTAEDLSPICGTGDYFAVYDGNGYTIRDRDGNTVLSDMTFYSVGNCFSDVFLVANADQTAYQLIDADGNILYEGADAPDYCDDIASGWWCVTPSDGPSTLISRNGTIENLGSSAFTLAPYDDDYHYTVLNTGKTLALGSDATILTYGMVYARDSSGQYVIYDLFTGDALGDTAYSSVLYSYGYVYALSGRTWHVFQVNRIYS